MNPKKSILLCCLVAVLITALTVLPKSVTTGHDQQQPPALPPGPCKRIISLAPSITEILFTLGLGDRVVGVTRYCTYPPEAAAKQQVGGYLDANYEAIVSLRPDLVCMTDSHRKALHYMKELNIPVLVVSHENIGDILASIKTIAAACGAAERAEKIISSLSKRIDIIRKKTKNRLRPRVLLTVERDYDAAHFRNIYIAGTTTYFSELIACAGGENAYRGSDIRYPCISGEGFLKLDPDIIIEMLPMGSDRHVSPRSLSAQWNRLADLTAVQNRRIHIFTQDFLPVPGPRFILTLEALARVIHPELAWN